MANVLVERESLADIADSIRAKNGTQNTYKPGQMAAAIDAIPSGGIAPTGTLEVTANGTYDVTNYASAEVDISADSDLLTAMITGEFDKSYSIPGTKIGRGFANCTGVFDIVFPNVTTLRQTNYAFEATQFNSMNFPVFAGALNDALRNYKGKHFIAPEAKSIRLADGCSNLIDIFIPKAELSTKSLASNNNLQIAVIGSFGNGTWQAFLSCSKLSAIDICQTSYKIDNAFQSCSVLETIIIRQTSIIELYNTSAFNNTPFASGGNGGTIYIPESLYDHLGDGTALDYKSSANWATVDGWGTITWAKIEGSYYETHYADGTGISLS